MKIIKIALLGFGTVSQGTFNLLQDNAELITNRSGVTIEISKIFVRNPDKYSHIKLPSSAQYVTNIDDVINDETIDIVVELMGGTTFAKECVEAALKHGKSVVTANKDLLAEAGPYLFDLAYKNKVDLRFEASVLGGIPIIRTLYDSLGGNRITELVGIMNGTTNFILSKMTDEGLSYGDVLKEAQDLGYAEADPTADVEGLDAARKLESISKTTKAIPLLPLPRATCFRLLNTRESVINRERAILAPIPIAVRRVRPSIRYARLFLFARHPVRNGAAAAASSNLIRAKRTSSI